MGTPVTAFSAYELAMRERGYGAVKRYHVMRTHRTQTVAEHSQGVAIIILQIFPAADARLLRAALTHDFHERDTGDMPSTAKWKFPGLKAAMQEAEDQWNGDHAGYGDSALPDFEKRILKWADYLELMLWSIEEMMLGNRYGAESYGNISRALEHMQPPTTEAGQLFTQTRTHGDHVVKSLYNLHA